MPCIAFSSLMVEIPASNGVRPASSSVDNADDAAFACGDVSSLLH